MGRIYIRKTEKGAGIRYARRSLDLAVLDVNNGRKTQRGAAKFYGIPRTTLKHYLDGTRGHGCVAGKSGTKGGGGKLQLGEENELQLVEGIKAMEKWGFGLSRSEVLDVVQTFVHEKNLRTRFKDGRPGEEWFLLFSKRHNLSIKKPQAVEAARMKQINPFTVYGFYDLLSNTIKDLKLEYKPSQIFNCDETSFSHDPSKTKVVGAKGSRTIRLTASCGRENTSVLLCVSASGTKLPPLCIFKGQNILESWVSQQETDKTAYSATKKGWMEAHLFLKWFTKCFLSSVLEERPILLIYDGHTSHISVDLIKVAKENYIHIIKLPPHTTHRLQPLDVAVNKSMKDRFDQELVKYQRNNPRKRIPKHLFVDILNKCLEAVPTSVVTNGFKKCGIYDQAHLETAKTPVNPSNFDKNLFLPEDLQRYETDQRRRQLENELQGENEDRNQRQEAASAENQVKNTEEIHGEDEERNTENEEIDDESTKDTRTINGNTSQRNINTPPIRRRRICTSAEIITKDDYLQKLEEENAIKQKKEEKKLEKQKQSKVRKDHITADHSYDNSSTSTTNDSRIKKAPRRKNMKKKREYSSSSESCEFDDSNSSESETGGPVAIEEDYVIVMYNGLYFPGRVQERGEDRVKVSCMEKYGKLGNSWRWPKVEDSIWYADAEVVKIIPPPKMMNHRGIFDVPLMTKYVH